MCLFLQGFNTGHCLYLAKKNSNRHQFSNYPHLVAKGLTSRAIRVLYIYRTVNCFIISSRSRCRLQSNDEEVLFEELHILQSFAVSNFALKQSVVKLLANC